MRELSGAYWAVALLVAGCTGDVVNGAVDIDRRPGDPPGPIAPGARPGADPRVPPMTTGHGMLNCPTVAAPSYTTLPSGGDLSPVFQSVCAGCHGAIGVGRPWYPSLPSSRSLEEYRTVVRDGRGANMPAFGPEVLTDAEIERDYAILTGAREPGTASGSDARTAPSTWSETKMDEVLSRGLAALRTPDRFGTACANCHSPDAIELAAIAFTDDDILRRGLQHVDPDTALDLVDYVHALRKRYGITDPCSKDWRPFQPGGEVLPGATTTERELAFVEVLRERNYLLLREPIASLEMAKAAAEELRQTNLRDLPIGVAFPRWSEDGFHGEAHASYNDWMPGAGRVPTNPAEWYALHDAYLANPTIQNLANIDNNLEEMTEQSYADSKGREIQRDYAARYNAYGWVENSLLIKHESVLLGAHFFRMALTGQDGWAEAPPLPFPHLNQQLNPFFHQGLLNAEAPCYGNEDCAGEVTEQLPLFMREEMDSEMTINTLSLSLSDSWSYLGQLLDQSLLTAENSRGATHDGHYWNLFTFEHRLVQQPFFSAHRVVTQEAYATTYRGTEFYPQALEDASRAAHVTKGFPRLPGDIHPLLHGNWTDIQGLHGPRTEDDDPRLEASLFLRANIALMFAYLQRELLQAGEPVTVRDRLLRHVEVLLRAPQEDIERRLGDEDWAASHPRLRGHASVFVDGAKALIDEVEALMVAAEEVEDPNRRRF
ncbi:MAG: c-type cytochrome [Myxococcota bacterium]